MTVKVADFGLSRDVYITDYYVMNKSNPLPVKWLAPEALFDKVFSENTDVISEFYAFVLMQLQNCILYI